MANKNMYFKFGNEIFCYNFHPSGGYEKLPAAEGKRLYSEQCVKALREFVNPGQTVYISVKHVSSSGLSRQLRVYVVRNGEIVDITYRVSKILDWRLNDNYNLVVSGCGVDIGFHTVYSLSSKLFPDGFKVDGVGRNGDTSGHDRDGGYALKHANI